MLPALLAQIGLPILTNIVAEALGRIDSPVTRGAAKALRDVDEAIARGKISPEQIEEAHRHTEKIAELELKERGANISEINKSLRAEIASKDQYVRRMRPTFGYLMALTWAAQMFGIAYVIIFDTARAGIVLNAMSSLSAIWAVGLSVLGIYVYKRSEDKKMQDQKEVIFWRK